jgi:hypothetical protein
MAMMAVSPPAAVHRASTDPGCRMGGAGIRALQIENSPSLKHINLKNFADVGATRVEFATGRSSYWQGPGSPAQDLEENSMRFMMLMIPKGYESAAPGTVPDAKAVEAMMKFNKQLQDAGVLLALDGLHPPSMGARVTFSGGKPTVTDGPFTEAKEVLGGYWMIQAASREEAIEWAKRCPGGDNEVIEVRQVQEMSDFPEDVRQAASGFDALGR